MKSLLHISDAAAIALHAVIVLADEKQRFSNREIAGALQVSEHHLAKVMQRLNKAGLVKSIRGPKGGFSLTSPPDQIQLIQVFEAIDGSLDKSRCLLGGNRPTCGSCIMGGLLDQVADLTKNYLSQVRVSDLGGFFDLSAIGNAKED